MTTMAGESTSQSKDLTVLLQAWSNGDRQALDELAPRVQNELHRIAQHYIGREDLNHTLQATALINEAYIRLINWKSVQWQNRAHFFGVSANLMRRILVDFARSRDQIKHGGEIFETSLDEAVVFQSKKSSDLVALDEALTRLTSLDPRKGQIIELRFFGGLSVTETAEVLKVSERTVLREWNLAKAWLYREVRSLP